MKKLHSVLYTLRFNEKGTTLIELLIVVSIIAVISMVSLLSLLGRSAQTDLSNVTEQMASLLREARAHSVSQASSTSWGVHFDNSTTTAPFYTLFYSQTYSTSTTIGYYKLPSGLAYATSSISSGSSVDVTFAQLSGRASSSASIKIYITGKGSSNSSTISVASSGAISF